ncbi:acyl-CoA desaturase [Pseudomonas sp.]|uniref:acyl-CoA desaturase n=1 Tax=Pseudomonas sp. TaxID=306 RepID=UPI0026356520|nr:acyl-CoA desaturase [Pseudomonas sp.]
MDGREHQYFIFAASVLPLAGLVAAVALLWNDLVRPTDLVVFAIMYTVVGFGVSAGYHRLLSHRSFETSRLMRFLFASAGAMAAQGQPIIWAAHHRRHHRVADKDGDPHSPYHDDTPGFRGLFKGLWHSHLGWLFDRHLTSDPIRYCPDLARDKDMRFISKHFVAFVLGGVALPGLLGWAFTGTFAGAATGALWGGLVRIFIGNHVTYAVNSIGHYFGRRRFATADESRNVAWLALASFGESWHNNHHAFPRSASHGMRWYEIDLTALLIRALAGVGLVWNVERIDPELRERRAENLARIGGGRAAAHEPPKPLAERGNLASVAVSDIE